MSRTAFPSRSSITAVPARRLARSQSGWPSSSKSSSNIIPSIDASVPAPMVGQGGGGVTAPRCAASLHHPELAARLGCNPPRHLEVSDLHSTVAPPDAPKHQQEKMQCRSTRPTEIFGGGR